MILKHTVQGTPYAIEIPGDEDLHQVIALARDKINEDLTQNGLKATIQGSLEELLANAIILTENDAQEVDLGEIPAALITPKPTTADNVATDAQDIHSLLEGGNDHELT